MPRIVAYKQKAIIKKALRHFIDSNEKNKSIQLNLDISHAEKMIEQIDQQVSATELLHECGGQWLGKIRNWIQCHCINGERVTWGSYDILQMNSITVKQLEYLAADIAAAAINEYRA